MVGREKSGNMVGLSEISAWGNYFLWSNGHVRIVGSYWLALYSVPNKGFPWRFLADYVYFETSSTAPYQIRRIEELNKVYSCWSASKWWEKWKNLVSALNKAVLHMGSQEVELVIKCLGSLRVTGMSLLIMKSYGRCKNICRMFDTEYICWFQTPNGNVEAKVMCFYRRRDISSSLIMLADKHQSECAY